MKKLTLSLSAAVKLLIIVLCLPFIAFGADQFDISYSLTEGGYRLELTPENANKGAIVSVDSNVSTRYEIIQSIVKPLENRDQPNITIRENFVFRGLRGTNQFGDFRVPTEDSPVRSNQTLYVSNTQGSSDSITLVYGITNIANIQPGYYTGRLSLTLRPIGSSRAQVVKYLDLTVNINLGEEEAIIKISSPTGQKRIYLQPKKDETKTADVEVAINGSFRQQFSIIQVLTQGLESNEGKRLDYEAVNFVVKDASLGTSANLEQALSANRQVIYTSLADGKADDSFFITYSLADIAGQVAGRYSSKIQYYLNQMGKMTLLETLPLEIEQERMFDLSITPQDQQGSLSFRAVKSNEPPKENEVLIQIKTNIGKRYQVNQKTLAPLTNKEGLTIPLANFTLRTENLDTKGSTKYPQEQAIKEGEMTLFVSDTAGSADTFKVIYKLNFPKDVKAGDYSTRITYSLLEI